MTTNQNESGKRTGHDEDCLCSTCWREAVTVAAERRRNDFYRRFPHLIVNKDCEFIRT